MLFIFAFIISLVVTMSLIPPIMKWADKIGAIDLPDARKVHSEAIPRVGGIAMVLGSVIAIVLLAELSQQVIAILVGFAVIWGFGLWDDRCELNYKIKFLGQLLAVVVVVTWGDVVVRTFPFIDGYLPDYIAIPFTIFALVGITNAINLSDGLDGLAGGTSLITISMVALLAYDAGGSDVVLIAMAVAGSILGFLRHNTHPARLFMGDTGSQFLGFSLGVLVIVLSQSVNSAMSPLIPLMLLGLPILDTFAVMGQRIYEKRSPFSPDKNHIHHKLLAIGLDQYEAVFVIYLLQSSFVALAYFMLYESDALLSLIYLIISALVLGVFHLASASSWQVKRQQVSHDSRLKQLINYLRETGLLVGVPTYTLIILVPVLLLLPIVFTQQVTSDMAVLALLLLLVLLVAMVSSSRHTLLLEKAVVYVVAVISVYHLTYIEEVSAALSVMNWLYLLLFLSFVLRIRFSHEKTFQVTPLDYLVIILIILVPHLPEMHLENEFIGEMAIKLVVLFYACEAVMGLSASKWNLMRIGAISTLLLVAYRGF